MFLKMKLFVLGIVLFLLFPCIGSQHVIQQVVFADSSMEKSGHWKEYAPNRKMNPDFPERQWWQGFHDPLLTRYIERALQENHDVQQAILRVSEAKWLVRRSFSKELPSVNINPTAGRIILPEQANRAVGSRTLSLYTAPMLASYELDIFGRNYDQIKAARQDEIAAEQDSHAIQISLAAEVASAYFNLVRADKQLQLAVQALQDEKRVEDLKKSQFQQGLTPYDDVIRSHQILAITQANWANYRNQQELFAHELSLLTGRPPATPSELDRGNLDGIQWEGPVSEGLPSTLITRRPDILLQEARLKRADMEVSIARKAFLPTISLTGLLGFGSIRFEEIFNGKNFFMAGLGALNQSLFAGGRNITDLKIGKIKAQEQIQAYQQSILQAFREVENALSNLKNDQEKQAMDQENIQLAQNQRKLAQSRADAGISPFLEVIQSQNELTGFQQSETQHKTAALIDILDLYKALGGGF